MGYVCDSAVKRKVFTSARELCSPYKKDRNQVKDRVRGRTHSAISADVNDLAAYCTPVERVDRGYANFAHGLTEPFLLSFFSMRALFSASTEKPVPRHDGS